jgi:DNA-directed RNA polymerase specialized sigma subunit
MKRVLSDRYFLGRKCVYCDSNNFYRLKDKRLKCKKCGKKYSLTQLKKEILILYYFYLELSASKTADELEIGYSVVHRKFMQFRKSIFNYCNNEAKKLNGELELNESY